MSSQTPEPPTTPVQIPWASDPMGEPGCRPAPHEPLATSWRTNHLRITTDSGVFTVRPAQHGETSAAPDTLFPDTSRVHILTAWNPAGLPKTLQDNLHPEAALWLFHGEEHPSSAVVYDAERSWVEPSIVLKDHDPSDVIDEARRFAQSVFLEWDSRGMRPVSSGLVQIDGLDESPYPVVVEPAPVGCPMTVGSVGPCRPAGGPYGSRAMNAAAMWQEHHALLLAAFGCADHCPAREGGAVSSTATYVPSRFGGWQWADRRGDDQREHATGHLTWIGDGLIIAFIEWDPEYYPHIITGAREGHRFAIAPWCHDSRWGLSLTHSEGRHIVGSRFISNAELRGHGLEEQRDFVWATLGELIGSAPHYW